MRAIDECQHCSSKAEISFGRDEGSRLTLIYWTCRRCWKPNVSAFDWELSELAACDVMRPGQAAAEARVRDFERDGAQQQRRHR